ncbi:MAG TPA: hypothetical protein VG168_16230 [Bryobacteraceae bacterium]|nr:hypothetical protein [Bryobacteraceae bacterium]
MRVPSHNAFGTCSNRTFKDAIVTGIGLNNRALLNEAIAIGLRVAELLRLPLAVRQDPLSTIVRHVRI